MPKTSDVLAVVVTHNRLELLKRCLAHLQQQSFPPDILVVNNGSSDGTEEWLRSVGIECYTQGNEGSAGGWYRGLHEGQARGYQYAWLMDDDGFPDKDALRLLRDEMTPDTAILSATVVKENARDQFVFGYPLLNERGFPAVFARNRKRGSFPEIAGWPQRYPFAFLFNGALVSLRHAAAVGNVRREYFMYGDEVDYFCRMKEHGRVETLFKALHYHPDVSQRIIEKKRVYYYIRNTIILNNTYFDMPALRNLLTLCVALVRIAHRNGLLNGFSYLLGGNAKYFYPAIADGLRRRFNNRY